jgi:hypothetical protein
MHVLHANPIHVIGDDIQPIHIVLHIFMIHPIVGRMDAIAYRSCGEKTLVTFQGTRVLAKNDLVLFKPC